MLCSINFVFLVTELLNYNDVTNKKNRIASSAVAPAIVEESVVQLPDFFRGIPVTNVTLHHEN